MLSSSVSSIAFEGTSEEEEASFGTDFEDGEPL